MSGRIEPARPVEAINLAAVADFTLGVLRVQPSSRRVGSGGREELVEPRVMQALIALAEAQGAVVSRDALIERCWGGRIVGEDAINRCIAKVRRLADTVQPAAFTIETVAKVGYRLLVSPVDARTEASPPVFGPATAPREQASVVNPSLRTSRWALGWRERGIAAFIVIVTVSGSVLTWRRDFPLVRSPAASLPAPFKPPAHSVAVLAFANMSGDASQEYFSDGLSEELIDLLSRVRQLHVVARTSSFSFKGQPATIKEIARKLNVESVLEGSVRRQGHRLRITAELNDAKTGYQLWTRDFDREAGDLLRLQTEIATAVTDALSVTLLADDAVKLAVGGTNEPQAFNEYLRGVRALRENTVDSYHSAIFHFETATKIDPRFALAYSGRADAVSYLAIVGPNLNPTDRHRMLVDALASADRGVDLAPELGSTHAARGFVLSNGLLDHARGFDELTQALAATPGNATIEMIYATVAISVGRLPEALAAARRSIELDPLRQDAWGCLGFVLFQARQYGASIDALQHARSVASIFPAQFIGEIGLDLLMQSKPEAARETCETTTEWEGLKCLALAYYVIGRKDDATVQLQKLRAILGDTGAYTYAEIYAQWGRPADALTWLKHAADSMDPALSDMQTDPLLDSIRSQPTFQNIRQSLYDAHPK